MSFGEKLKKEYMKRKKDKDCSITSEEDFAELLDINVRTLQLYMNGSSMPNLKRAKQICKKLDVSLDFMFLDVDNSIENEEIYIKLKAFFMRDDKNVLKYAKVFMDFLASYDNK